MDKSYIPEGRNTKRGGKSTAVAMGDSNGMQREIQQNTTLMKNWSRFTSSFPTCNSSVDGEVC